jgi:FtsZ-binding cell division protein ZapB
MDYNLDSKLRDKADTWKVSELEGQIRNLKSEVHDLKSKNDYWQRKLNNAFRAIEELTNILLFKEASGECENLLQNIKQYLY